MDDIVLTRLDTGAKVFLPPDIRWVDEYEWHAIAQATPERTLDGGLVVQQGKKRNGRPITLRGEWAWLDLATVPELRDWSDVPELTMTLRHYDGREFRVIFRLHDGGFGKVEPVRFAVPEVGNEPYSAEIYLMTF